METDSDLNPRATFRVWLLKQPSYGFQDDNAMTKLTLINTDQSKLTFPNFK